MFFLELSRFFYDPMDVVIWLLVPLPFLSPAWTSGSSWFIYCWSLTWRILSINLRVCVSQCSPLTPTLSCPLAVPRTWPGLSYPWAYHTWCPEFSVPICSHLQWVWSYPVFKVQPHCFLLQEALLSPAPLEVTAPPQALGSLYLVYVWDLGPS